MVRSIKAEIKKFYSNAPATHRRTMLEMRNRILSIIPNAEETISYGMPAYKVNGHVVAGIKCNKSNIGYYPFSGSIIKLFPKELQGYSKTLSAIHVPLNEPLPKSLLKKLIQARISRCPVKRGEVNLGKYDSKDQYWKSLKLAAPARRGLVDNGIFKLADLKKWNESDVRKIHAIGPSAIKVITSEMKKKKISFRRGR